MLPTDDLMVYVRRERVTVGAHYSYNLVQIEVSVFQERSIIIL